MRYRLNLRGAPSPPVAGARRRGLIIALLMVLLGSPAIATPAQNGEDRDEIEQGREADRMIEAEFGFYEDEPLAEYVSGIGSRLAAMSERPTLPWTFRVLDSPVVNAFALPGGFVYVTRGLLAYAGSEAELAGVIGHEIGHVTGRHSRSRQRRSLFLSLGILAGAVLSDTVADLVQAGLPQRLAGLVFLKYSRDQELDADERGIRYATSIGYDPYGIGGFFETLQSLGEQSDRREVPGWVSTHPQVDSRIERSNEWAAAALARYNLRPEDLFVGRVELLDEIDGIVFGEDPREGYMDGNEFLHADLGFQVRFPDGWEVQNGRSAVTATGDDAYIRLTLEDLAEGQSADEYVGAFLRRLDAGVNRPESVEINGLDAIEAIFSVSAEGSDYYVLGTWIEYDGRFYQLLGVTSPRAWRDNVDVLGDSIRSFGELRDDEARGVVPARLAIVESSQRLQLRGIVEQHPAITITPETVAILNHLGLDDPVDAGALVKLVFGGPRAG